MNQRQQRGWHVHTGHPGVCRGMPASLCLYHRQALVSLPSHRDPRHCCAPVAAPLGFLSLLSARVPLGPADPDPAVLSLAAGGRFCSGKRAGLPAQRPFPVIQKVVASMAHLQEEKLRLQEELLALQEKLAARESEEMAVSVQLRGQVGGLWARSGLPAVGCDL